MGSIYKTKVYQIPDQDFQTLVLNSTSYNQIIKHISLVPCGASNKAVKSRISELQLSVNHFKLRKTDNFPSAIPFENLLKENSDYNRGDLKRRLIKQGLLKEQCALCPLGPIWNGKPLVLQLDHINGINNDNQLENLRLLCPNCHTQTDTFGGRRKRKKYYCKDCKNETKGYGNFCLKCAASKQKEKFSIPIEELKILVWKIPSTTIAKQYGVSSKTVEKRCKKLGIEKPSRGYWKKIK